ncbi:MAG: LysR family transcriptional regulator [Burkholderiaceae bacterium]
MENSFNYKHLHYFWVVAQEGSITQAAERLDVASQTISGQIKLLEKSLGHALFAPKGRGLTLTEAGRITQGFADRIFLLGEQLTEAMNEPGLENTIRLNVGTTDSLPKLIAYELLEPLLTAQTTVRLQCHEGEFEQLLAELALHQLDVVLADRPMPASSGLRVYSHQIGESPVGLFGKPALIEQYQQGFPQSLDRAPMLLPTRHTALRSRLDNWLQTESIRPRVIGEFEDSALLATFAGTGLGFFPAVLVSRNDLASQYDAHLLAEIPALREQVFAITNEQRIQHPLVESLLSNGRRLWGNGQDQ